MSYQVSDIVHEGKKVAASRGMATANINGDLPVGIYTGECEYGGCLIYVAEPPEIEVHIIGADKISLYGCMLKVYNINKIPDTVLELVVKLWKEKKYVE